MATMTKPVTDLGLVDLYVDMDGTTAKFYEHSGCLELMYEPGFFRSLNAYENVIQALVILAKKGVNLHILSALPDAKCGWVVGEKQEWIQDTELREHITSEIFTLPGQDKAKAAGIKPFGMRIPVLLDDFNKNLREWRAAGGLSVKMVNEINDTGKIGPLWTGYRVRYDWTAERIADEILAIVQDAC